MARMENHDDTDIRSVHVIISGRVQGVGFRAWVRRTADNFGVSGWVRNCRNGDVEAVFSGPEAAVAAMVAACGEGPDWARVAEVRETGPADPATGPLTIRTDR